MSTQIAQKPFSVRFDEDFEAAAKWVGTSVPNFFKISEYESTAAKVAVAAIAILTAVVFAVPLFLLSLANRAILLLSRNPSEVKRHLQTLEQFVNSPQELVCNPERERVLKLLLEKVTQTNPKNKKELGDAAISAVEKLLSTEETSEIRAYACEFLDQIDVKIKKELLDQYIFSIESARAPDILDGWKDKSINACIEEWIQSGNATNVWDAADKIDSSDNSDYEAEFYPDLSPYWNRFMMEVRNGKDAEGLKEQIKAKILEIKPDFQPINDAIVSAT